jgi:hypothetical protein
MPLCGTHNDLCFGREDGALGAMGAMDAVLDTCRHTSLHAYTVCRTCAHGLNCIASSVSGCLLAAYTVEQFPIIMITDRKLHILHIYDYRSKHTK